MKILNIIKDQLYPISLYSRQIAGTMVLLLVVRFLSVYDYGLFSSYKIICTFCLMFANLDYANYILVSSKAKVNEVKLKIALFMLHATLLLLFIAFISFFCPLESKLIFALVLLRTFFDNTFFNLMLPYYQASGKFNLISWINIFYSIATLIITIICYIFKFNLVKFLLLSVALGFFNFVQCSYYAKIGYFMLFKHLKRIIAKIDKEIFAYIFGALTCFLYSQIPPLYISLMIKKEEVALFAAASTIAGVMYILVNAQNQKIIPELIRGSYIECVNIIRKNMLFIFSILLSILFVLIFAGKIILKLVYGNDFYSNANIILIILMIGNMFIGLGAIYGAYITAKGNQKYKPRMMLEASGVSVISLLILHKFGIYGAAVAFLFAAVYAGTRYFIFTKKMLYKHKISEGGS